MSRVGVNTTNLEVPVGADRLRIGVNVVNLEIPVVVVQEQLRIGVNAINFEIPVAEAQVIEEVFVQRGGVSTRPRVLGGRPYQRDTLFTGAKLDNSLIEKILYEELVENICTSNISAKTIVRRPVYNKTGEIVIRSYTLQENGIITETDSLPLNKSRKEEEEFILFGII